MPADGVHRKACPAPVLVAAVPTTWPRSFIVDENEAVALYPPPRVPRSSMPPDAVHRNA